MTTTQIGGHPECNNDAGLQQRWHLRSCGGWSIISIGVIYDNETRRWCMRTRVYVPDVGNRIYIEPLTEPLAEGREASA